MSRIGQDSCNCTWFYLEGVHGRCLSGILMSYSFDDAQDPMLVQFQLVYPHVHYLEGTPRTSISMARVLHCSVSAGKVIQQMRFPHGVFLEAMTM